MISNNFAFWKDTGNSVMYTTHLVDENSGTVTVEVEITFPNSKVFTATGSSKASKEDPFDVNVGYELAYGRALRALGRQILASGHRQVHETDRFRTEQKAASERALLKRKKVSKKLKKKYVTLNKKKENVKP